MNKSLTERQELNKLITIHSGLNRYLNLEFYKNKNIVKCTKNDQGLSCNDQTVHFDSKLLSNCDVLISIDWITDVNPTTDFLLLIGNTTTSEIVAYRIIDENNKAHTTISTRFYDKTFISVSGFNYNVLNMLLLQISDSYRYNIPIDESKHSSHNKFPIEIYMMIKFISNIGDIINIYSGDYKCKLIKHLDYWYSLPIENSCLNKECTLIVMDVIPINMKEEVTISVYLNSNENRILHYKSHSDEESNKTLCILSENDKFHIKGTNVSYVKIILKK